MNQEEIKTPSFFRFEDLRIYHKAIDFTIWLLNLGCKADKAYARFFEKFIDEATAVALNIAEGSAKNKATFATQLKDAKGNIRKAMVYMTIGVNTGVITAEEEEEIRTQLMEMTKMIGALISSLQRTTNQHETSATDNSFDAEMNW